MNHKCPCCFSENYSLWPLSGLLLCGNCGHLWQKAPKPIDYSGKYLDGYKNLPTVELSWVRLTYLSLFKKQGCILDIGCGDGEFIRQAGRAGFIAVGYDVNGDKVNVEKIDSLRTGFDIVTMFDSFEHMPDLSQPFIVAPSVFVVTVPWLPEGVTDENVTAWRHYKPDEHLHYFTEMSLRAVFLRHGYGMVIGEPVEDLIRKNPQASPNTMTFIFKKITKGD